MEIAQAACAEKTQGIFDRSPFGVFRRGIFQSEHSIIKCFFTGKLLFGPGAGNTETLLFGPGDADPEKFLFCVTVGGLQERSHVC